MEDKNRFLKELAQTNPSPFLVEVDRAEGIYIYDVHEKKYMDLIEGLCVNNIGHNHPKIIKSIKNQLEKHLHVMVYGEFVQRSQMDLSKNLLKHAGKIAKKML